MSDSLKEIQWGIIGCGNVTEKKSGPAFGKVKGSSLVAVMRRSANLAEEYARRHGIPKWYDDAEALLSDRDVNAVYVATPPSSHADYAIRSMLAGKPVYVEKPMASSYTDCLRMNKVATETGVRLFTAYYRRSLPYFLKVKELVDKEVAGKVMIVSITLHVPPRPEDYHAGLLPWRVIPSIAGGGYFYDLASHQIDLLDFLFGPITAAFGRTYNRSGLYTAEDTVFATLEFENGIVANGSWCFTVHPGNQYDKIEILGSDGVICFSTFQNTPITVTSKNKRSEYLPDVPENIQFYLIKSIVEELQGIGKSPSDGSNGERANMVMDMILGKIK